MSEKDILSIASEDSIVTEDAIISEVNARHLLDVSFKFTWKIRNYLKDIEEGLNIDSPSFQINVNGLRSVLNLSLRFWSDEDGKRLTNPVVVCLNLLSHSSSAENPETEVIQFRHNFGLWNDIVKQHEIAPMGAQKVTFSHNIPKEKQSLQSIAVRDVLILDRHLIDGKDIEIICKLCLVREKVEHHTLALDLWNKLVSTDKTDIIIRSAETGDSYPAHRLLLSARSVVLTEMMESVPKGGVLTLDISTPVLTSILQYIYTDRVEPMDHSQLPQILRFSDQLALHGLKTMCEKALIDSITPSNVASLLLVASNFSCDLLKSACLCYVEENPHSIQKSMAWKVMENLAPALYEEVASVV